MAGTHGIIIFGGQKGIGLGIGEILLTSIDQEVQKGFDIELIEKFSNFLNKNKISIPIIVSGGMGKLDDLNKIYKIKNIDSIAVADLLHYKRNSIEDIKNQANKIGFEIRKV